MTQKENKINIHQDYILFNLFVVLYNTAHTIMSQIQEKTPYCNEYEKAYRYYSSQVLKTLHEYERYCRKCQDKQESEVK